MYGRVLLLKLHWKHLRIIAQLSWKISTFVQVQRARISEFYLSWRKPIYRMMVKKPNKKSSTQKTEKWPTTPVRSVEINRLPLIWFTLISILNGMKNNYKTVWGYENGKIVVNSFIKDHKVQRRRWKARMLRKKRTWLFLQKCEHLNCHSQQSTVNRE